MRLAAYLRCSTETQDDSLETQEQIIRDWCPREGHELVETFSDFGISASVPVEKRPGGYELFAAVAEKKRAFEGIVVVRVDRLFRDPMDELSGLVFLDAHKCQLLSIKDPIDRSTPQGEFLHGAMMYVRRLERRLTGQRVKDHNLALALSGKWPAGIPPLGYTYDPQTKTINLNDRAPEVTVIFKEFFVTGGNASQTARVLNSMGYTSRDGHPFRANSVLAILKSSVYRRRLKYDGRVVDAPELIPAILPEWLIEEVDRLLAAIAQPSAKRQRPSVYAYSSRLYCSECGSRMKRSGVVGDHASWVCCGKREFGSCDSRTVSEKYIDRLVGQAVHSMLESIDLNPKDVEAPQAVRTDGRESRLKLRRKRIVEAFIDGLISREERDKRLAEIEAELAALSERSQETKLTPQRIQDIIDQIGSSWESLSQAVRKETLVSLGARLTLCTHRKSKLWVELETDLPVPTVRVEAHYRNAKPGRWGCV